MVTSTNFLRIMGYVLFMKLGNMVIHLLDTGVQLNTYFNLTNSVYQCSDEMVCVGITVVPCTKKNHALVHL